MAQLIKSKRYFFGNRAQSILEYSVFIVIIALVFLSFHTRSNIQNILQGRWRKDVSVIGKEQYRGGANPSSASYITDVTEDSIVVLQGDAYIDEWGNQ